MLLGVISALLDNLTPPLSHANYPRIILPLLMRPLLAVPTPAPSLVYSTAFIVTAAPHSMHLCTSVAKRRYLPLQHSTTSFDSRIMKTLLLELVSSGKSRGTHESSTRALVSVGKRCDLKGAHRGTWYEGVAQESRTLGYNSLGNRGGALRVLSRLRVTLSRCCTILGCIFRTVPLIKVACTPEPHRRQ